MSGVKTSRPKNSARRPRAETSVSSDEGQGPRGISLSALGPGGSVHARQLGGRRLLGALDPEELGPADATGALDRGATVLHRHLFGVLDLTFLAAFHTIRVSCHNYPPSCARTGLRKGRLP